jgi:hypothetical protein
MAPGLQNPPNKNPVGVEASSLKACGRRLHGCLHGVVQLGGSIGARRRWSTTLSGETSYISGIATICWAMHPPGRGSSFIACRPRGVLKKGGCTPRQSSDPPILEQGTAGWVGHQSLDKTRRVETLPPGRTQMSEPLACAPTRCRQKTHGGCRLGGPTPRHTPRQSHQSSSITSFESPGGTHTSLNG